MDHYRPPEEYYEAMAPMTGETVTLTSASDEQKTAKIDNEGFFSFSDLAPGKYKIEVTVPAGMAPAHGYARGSELLFGLDALEIRPKGCAEVIFRTQPDGHISGRIVDQDGAPLPNVTVIACKTTENFNIYADTYTHNNNDGTFDLGRLPPGEYKLAAHVWTLSQGDPILWADRNKLTIATLRFFPRATSPDTAKPIKLELGENVGGVEIQIPFDPAQWKDVKTH